jgi:hypothetical protein
MCDVAYEALRTSYNLKTCKRDTKAFMRWAAFCRSKGTTEWRDDIAANTGQNLQGYKREVILLINALVHFHQTMTYRPKGTARTRAKPESAMNIIRAVRRVHKVNMIPLIPLTSVNAALNSITKKFVDEFGANAMTPQRAAPFTNQMLHNMLSASGELRVTPRHSIQWISPEGLALKAMLAICRSTAMRKSELISHEGSHALKRSNLAWLIAGVLHRNPAEAMLQALGPGDYLVISPPPSKADPFGVVWGSLPIYVAYTHSPTNTANLVARLVIQTTGASANSELLQGDYAWNHAFLDKAIRAWVCSLGTPVAQAARFSFHSGRAYLACALMAAGRPPHVIQALCRWQSADSLRVYCCLNPSTYASHLMAAEGATVAGIRGAHIPLIDSMDMAFSLQQAQTDNA